MYFLTVYINMHSDSNHFSLHLIDLLNKSTALGLIKFTFKMLHWSALDLFIYLEFSPKPSSTKTSLYLLFFTLLAANILVLIRCCAKAPDYYWAT